MTTEPGDTMGVVEAAINGTGRDTLQAMIAGLGRAEANRLLFGARSILAACHDVRPTELDDVRNELSRHVAAATYAADRGDYQSSHRHRDRALVDALQAVLDHPAAALELATIALDAVGAADERHYLW